MLKLPIVAKFLCSYGQNENLINFEQPHEFFLEREPQNKYDQRAIRVGVRQSEKYLLLKGVEHAANEKGDDDQELDLFLGYVPKDISYNLSVLLDNPSIFEFQVVDYCSEGKNTSVIFLLVGLKKTILRD